MDALTQQNTKARFTDLLERGVLREIGYPALIVSLVLFVCAMALLGANVSELRRSYARVQRANEALVQIAMINTDILRAEMIIRGYALSGDPIYLRWKDMAYRSLHRRLTAIHVLSAGDRVQMDNLDRLQTLIAEHHSYFNQLAGRVPTDRAAVVAEIVEYGKKVKRAPIEALLRTMRADEMNALSLHQKTAERQVTNAYHYAIGISAVALVLGALGFALVINDRRRQRRR